MCLPSSQVFAPLLPGIRKAHDRIKPTHAATFPNLHRVYDDKSRAVAEIAWQYCLPQEIWAIITSKFLSSGKQETMAWFHHTATKYAHERVYLGSTNVPGEASHLQKVRSHCFLSVVLLNCLAVRCLECCAPQTLDSRAVH